MTIFQLISGSYVNGAIRHCYDLTCELALRGHRVVLGHDGDDDRDDRPGRPFDEK